MTQHQAGAIETVMGKARFEQWLWDQCVSKVKFYHGDNGIFSAEECRRDCEEKGQSQSFSGVGAQHQNARAERAIHPIANLVPPDFDGHEGVQLTPNITQAPEGAHQRTRGNAFSMDLQLYYNCVPNAWSGLTPLELVTKERSDYKDILCCHVWGCPVYVL
jgi:transposase InsO family protein